jgi:DNA-binding NtrC family response regulator
MDPGLHILVVDDDRMMTRTLHDIFEVKGYDVEVAHSGPEALEKMAQFEFDCVLSDIKMPGIDGVQFYKTIKAERPGLPVVLMTAYTADRLVQEGLDAGVIAVLTKPLDLEPLLGFFGALRRKRSIAIVDDDPAFCRTLSDVLQRQDFKVLQVTENYHSILERVDLGNQVILLDMKLSNVDGLAVLEQIRAQYPRLPVILITGHKTEMSSAVDTAMKLGAYACFYKPLQMDMLLQALDEIHHRRLRQVLGGLESSPE